LKFEGFQDVKKLRGYTLRNTRRHLLLRWELKKNIGNGNNGIPLWELQDIVI
jgi:hypothetical protein